MAVAQNAGYMSRIPNMDPNYERPVSGLTRGVQISNLEESRINPEPLVLEESDLLLEQHLSPSKLTNESASQPGPHAEMLSERLLTGVDDLEQVHSLEMKVDTTETSLGNFGALLPNLRQLKLSDSVIHGIRDIGSSLRGLRVLWLCRCGLRELDGIASMTSLKELYLSYNEISDISPISMIDTLEILDLEGNYIDDVAQIQYLGLCQSLKSLSLEGNPVCLLRHPSSKQTDYNYREFVKKVLPKLHLLDEEPLEDGRKTSRKPNAFHDDWAYLEELQKDALVLESLVDTVHIGTESGSRPSTAALRPATAYRPGTALRRPDTVQCPLSGRSPTGSARPVSAVRPSTSNRPGTSLNRPNSTDSSEVDATSDLTMGNVICGNPSRALKHRGQKRLLHEETMKKQKERLIAESGREVTSDESPNKISVLDNEVIDPSFREEINEWRKHHDKVLAKLEEERAPQILVIDHENPPDSHSSNSASDDNELEDSEELSSCLQHFDNPNRHEQFRAPNLGLKHDESFEADDEEEVVLTSLPRAQSPKQNLHSGCSRGLLSGSSVVICGGQPSTMIPSGRMPLSMSFERDLGNTTVALPPPVIRTLSTPVGSPSPPPFGPNHSHTGTPPSRGMRRRQLPKVPSLPSKPPVPKS